MHIYPAYGSVRTVLQRERLHGLPKLPKTIEDVVIEGEWAETLRGESFLLPNSTKDLQIFTTNDNLKFLEKCKTIYVDGTFHVCPKLYSQLYSLHGLLNGWVIPLVFALLSDKTRESYAKLFGRIRDAMAGLRLVFNPTNIMSDFESGLLETVRYHLPGTRHLGCHFHFSQAVWRKVQEVGLVVAYKENEEVSTFVQKCIGLAFIPAHEVVGHFYEMERGLNSNVRSLLAIFITYFRSTWLEGSTAYAISMWNKYGMGHHHRTNNYMESWHAQMKRDLPCHPNIFVFLRALKIGQANAEMDIAKVEAGIEPPTRRPKHVNFEQKIANAHQKHVDGRINTDSLLCIVQYHTNICKK